MIDYITREDALTAARYSKNPIVAIMRLPRVDPNDFVQHGKWIQGLDMTHHCSVCNEWCNGYAGKYCSNCGAKMDLGVEE